MKCGRVQNRPLLDQNPRIRKHAPKLAGSARFISCFSSLSAVCTSSSRLEILDRRLGSLDQLYDEPRSAFLSVDSGCMDSVDEWMHVWMAEWAGFIVQGKGRKEKGREGLGFEGFDWRASIPIPANHNHLHLSSHGTINTN